MFSTMLDLGEIIVWARRELKKNGKEKNVCVPYVGMLKILNPTYFPMA